MYDITVSLNSDFKTCGWHLCSGVSKFQTFFGKSKNSDTNNQSGHVRVDQESKYS